MNSDYVKELIFAISVGYSITPRRIYSYDFANDTLLKSPKSCSAVLECQIINNAYDQESLIAVSTAAVGNCDSMATLTDRYTWLMVLDKNLKFKFNPFKIGFYPSYLSVIPIKIKNEIFLVALNIYFGKENHPCSIALYDLEGNKVKEKNFSYTAEWHSARLINEGENYNNIFF